MPKRPGIKGKDKAKNKEKIEQYVKDYLSTCGIDYKTKNKNNSLLSVHGGAYEIYCGTELYINKKTLEKKHGLRSMVKEIMKLKIREEKKKDE